MRAIMARRLSARHISPRRVESSTTTKTSSFYSTKRIILIATPRTQFFISISTRISIFYFYKTWHAGAARHGTARRMPIDTLRPYLPLVLRHPHTVHIQQVPTTQLPTQYRYSYIGLHQEQEYVLVIINDNVRSSAQDGKDEEKPRHGRHATRYHGCKL